MRSLVCNRPGALADRGTAATPARRGRGSWFESAAPASAGPIFIFSKVRIRSWNIRGSSGTNCPAKWRTAGPGCTIAVGQQVYIIPYLSCGACVACRRGKTNCCQRIARLGRPHRRRNGRLRLRPGSAMSRAADGVTLDQAAMVEFLAIGAHAVRRANPRQGDRVLVVGAGPDRRSAACCSQGLQGGSVTALDMRQDRLDFCRKRLGVDHAVAAGPNARQALSEAHRRRLLRYRHRRDRKSQMR